MTPAMRLGIFPQKTNLLDRTSDTAGGVGPTPVQQQVDQMVENFVGQATDWKSLAAMTAGGIAYRLGRIGILASGGSKAGVLIRGVSLLGGLATEVATFEIAHRSFASFTGEGHSHSRLWSWNGVGGLKEGFLSSLVTFGTLKGFGKLAQRQNLILQHLAQDTGMVLGHQASAFLGITPAPEGSLAEQFLHAEVTNLQMGAGMALGHSLSGGKLHAIERKLEMEPPTAKAVKGGEKIFPLELKDRRLSAASTNFPGINLPWMLAEGKGPGGPRKRKSELPSVSTFGLSLKNYSIYEEPDPPTDIYLFEKEDLSQIDGFGFLVIKNGKGLIRQRGFYFSSRLTIFDPTTKVSVDSHLPVDYEDLDVFKRDFLKLMKHLRKMGVQPEKAKMDLIYGNEHNKDHIQHSGELIVKILEELGLTLNSVRPARGDDKIYDFNLETGEITEVSDLYHGPTIYGIAHEGTEEIPVIEKLLQEAYRKGARSVGLEMPESILKHPTRRTVFKTYAHLAQKLGMKVIALEQEENFKRRTMIDVAKYLIDENGQYDQDALARDIRTVKDDINDIRYIATSSPEDRMELAEELSDRRRELKFLRSIEAFLKEIDYNPERHKEIWTETVLIKANQEMWEAIKRHTPDLVLMGRAHVEAMLEIPGYSFFDLIRGQPFVKGYEPGWEDLLPHKLEKNPSPWKPKSEPPSIRSRFVGVGKELHEIGSIEGGRFGPAEITLNVLSTPSPIAGPIPTELPHRLLNSFKSLLVGGEDLKDPPRGRLAEELAEGEKRSALLASLDEATDPRIAVTMKADRTLLQVEIYDGKKLKRLFRDNAFLEFLEDEPPPSTERSPR
jgi:hypothetical protein